MSEPEFLEGRQGVNRIEAFSDGVLAIVITIMVLELKVPEQGGIRAIGAMWPTFLAYGLSYAYVAIYWVNHHRLFSYARQVTAPLLWSNIALLFALSLVPFATAFVGTYRFDGDGARIYMAVLLLPAFAYTWLQAEIRRSGDRSQRALLYHTATQRKGIAATITYAAGLPLSYASPWLSIGCAALVAVFWMLPWGPLDRLFLRCPGPDGE